MSLLVVMAHFDVARTLRPHTLSALTNYADAADRVVVVSAAGVREQDLDLLPPRVELVVRSNYGYDFFSYKWGLDVVGDYAAYDRILLVNDTFIGPLVPAATILSSGQASAYDLMGATWSHNHGGHAQSFFVTVTGAVARSNAFQRFWRDMVPVSERKSVIMKYEVGMTAAVTDVGFAAGGYFQPTAKEEALAMERRRHQDAVRLVSGSGGRVVREVRPSSRHQLRGYNPAIALADRALLDARLPVIKFDTLRFDPYGLDAATLLREAEVCFPEHLDGVRDFLRATRPNYPFRAREHNALTDLPALERAGLGYCLDEEYLADRAREGLPV
ncbi:MAG: rhamnan synthesis F family protein [Microbacterium sp.]